MKIVRVTIQCVMDVDTNKPVMVNLPADDSGRIIVTDRAAGKIRLKLVPYLSHTKNSIRLDKPQHCDKTIL